MLQNATENCASAFEHHARGLWCRKVFKWQMYIYFMLHSTCLLFMIRCVICGLHNLFLSFLEIKLHFQCKHSPFSLSDFLMGILVKIPPSCKQQAGPKKYITHKKEIPQQKDLTPPCLSEDISVLLRFLDSFFLSSSLPLSFSLSRSLSLAVMRSLWIERNVHFTYWQMCGKKDWYYRSIKLSGSKN